jgi:hypothetical protein
VPHLQQYVTSVSKVTDERSMIFTLKCHALGKGATFTIDFNVLGLTWPVQAGLELTTSRMQSESATTLLPQPVREEIGRSLDSSSHLTVLTALTDLLLKSFDY